MFSFLNCFYSLSQSYICLPGSVSIIFFGLFSYLFPLFIYFSVLACLICYLFIYIYVFTCHLHLFPVHILPFMSLLPFCELSSHLLSITLFISSPFVFFDEFSSSVYVDNSFTLFICTRSTLPNCLLFYFIQHLCTSCRNSKSKAIGFLFVLCFPTDTRGTSSAD